MKKLYFEDNWKWIHVMYARWYASQAERKHLNAFLAIKEPEAEALNRHRIRVLDKKFQDTRDDF